MKPSTIVALSRSKIPLPQISFRPTSCLSDQAHRIVPFPQRPSRDSGPPASAAGGVTALWRDLTSSAASSSAGPVKGDEPDPRDYPDRPAPPEARPIVEPPSDDSTRAVGAPEGYVSLMQQIVGAVRVRPVDPAAQSRLEQVRHQMEAVGQKRESTQGTITVAQLRRILLEAQQQGAVSRAWIEGVAVEHALDAKLLEKVLGNVCLAEEKPLRDGGALLGI